MNKVFLENEVQTIEQARELVIDEMSYFSNIQRKFLKTNLGQAINSGIDVGLKIVLPNFLEDEVIEVKNSLLTEGFQAALDTAIEESINIGKSLTGMITGNFENVSQIKKAVEKGGLSDCISEILDEGIKWTKEKGYISKSAATAIKKGKNKVMDSITKGVENSLTNQIESIEKIDGYIDKWYKYYEEQNFSNMEYQYNKIQENLSKVMPIEETLIKARKLENLHELIKNKGKNFNLTEEEKELAEMLIK